LHGALGITAADAALSRVDLSRLMQRFPDR
jgi:tail assembly chaperone